MFAVSGDPDGGVLNFRNITQLDNALEVTIDPYIFMHTDHRVLIALNYQTDEHSVVRSMQDITRVRKVSPQLCPRGHYDDNTCLIDERLFASGKDRDTIVLQDITLSTQTINLCDTTDKYRILLRSARWNSHTWVSTNMDHRGTQYPDSRDLCTIVDMNTRSSAENAQIATGNCLYGHVVDSTNRHFITALDPRETTSAREVYSDGVKLSWCDFRDVPNGIAVAAMFDELGNTYIVNIFDERACAMIGTDIFLSKNMYLFCVHAGTIEIYLHITHKCIAFSEKTTLYVYANCVVTPSYVVNQSRATFWLTAIMRRYGRSGATRTYTPTYVETATPLDRLSG